MHTNPIPTAGASDYGRGRRLNFSLDRPVVVSADALPPQPLIASIQPEPPLG